ncbi:hypothetical protein NLX67_14980 [Domibacillus sp. A3M-37]|uniref:hypothetical protein n=1 Tax=Domibacillus sp. A3M-37 TaxID=2962037 RepID=UPI0020B81C11|nr:hypothetical protein [Domibacillus sp. A3M-37]MCP3763678.1 hypothetical protein [Domibacillus sp. A3M-37]
MKISNVEVVNTGGGCLVTCISVSPKATDIEGLKMIGINGEGVVGYSSEEVTGDLDDVLFIAENFEDAILFIGEEFAAECKQINADNDGRMPYKK